MQQKITYSEWCISTNAFKEYLALNGTFYRYIQPQWRYWKPGEFSKWRQNCGVKYIKMELLNKKWFARHCSSLVPQEPNQRQWLQHPNNFGRQYNRCRPPSVSNRSFPLEPYMIFAIASHSKFWWLASQKNTLYTIATRVLPSVKDHTSGYCFQTEMEY